MNVNGPVLVFGIASVLSGLLMTFFPNALYDWQAKIFFNRLEYLGILKILGPITILIGVGLFVGSLARLI